WENMVGAGTALQPIARGYPAAETKANRQGQVEVWVDLGNNSKVPMKEVSPEYYGAAISTWQAVLQELQSSKKYGWQGKKVIDPSKPDMGISVPREPGLYWITFGQGGPFSGRKGVYVGMATNLWDRISHHERMVRQMGLNLSQHDLR